MNNTYPDEFITDLIQYAIVESPNSSVVLEKYASYWSMLGDSDISNQQRKDFYVNEILEGNWVGLDSTAVQVANQVLIASGEYWGSTPVNGDWFYDPEPNSDAIGTAVFTILGSGTGPLAPVFGTIAGQITSYAVGGLIENWGNW